LKILAVGGAGYVGSTSVESFLDAGHEVVVYDSLTGGHAKAVPPGAELVVGDIRDGGGLDRVLSDGVDAVLHCAARSLVGESMADPGRGVRRAATGADRGGGPDPADQPVR
jgi:UDP-glucose 4-epimerase